MVRVLLSEDQARMLLELTQDRMLEMALEQGSRSPINHREKTIVAALIVRLQEALNSSKQRTL